MAQLVPVIGAAVGAVANYRLLQQLGATAINCYRLRYFAAPAAAALPPAGAEPPTLGPAQ